MKNKIKEFIAKDEDELLDLVCSESDDDWKGEWIIPKTSRDPKRIQVVLGKIQKIWEKHPDLRFGQLIINFCSYLDQKKIHFYGIEDDEFIREFEKFYDSL